MTTSEINIRRLAAADAALYREIRLEALKQNPEAFGSTFESESAEPVDWFAERLVTAAVFGASAGGELLGIAGLFVQRGRKHTHKGTLWTMYVRPAARNAGIGRRLVEAVINHARSEVELIQLSVISSNQAARHLYASLGFVEYGLEQHALKQDGHYWDEILMAKSLSPDKAARS